MESVLLQSEVRNNIKDLQDYCRELKEWGEEMKRKDKGTKSGTADNPEVSQTKIQKTEDVKEVDIESEKQKSKKSKRISAHDYKAWEKFDADAYCAKLDNEGGNNEPSSDESELSNEFDEGMVDLANSEKEKGNKFVKKQRWDEAIQCYTKAIECYAYDPIYYANRALCHLKKESYRNAESDCTTALQLDKTYVKAYQRRAAARENLNQLREARDDLLRVLELEKNNKESKAALVRVEKKSEDVKHKLKDEKFDTKTQRPVSKFTLSRQEQKQSPSELKIKPQVSSNKCVESTAIKAHVTENITPSTSKYFSAKFDTHMSDTIRPPEEMPAKLTSSVWPSGSNVELFKSVTKPPKERSKKPLKRVEIVETDLKTDKQLQDGITKTEVSKDEGLQKKDIESNKMEDSKSVPRPVPKEGDGWQIIMDDFKIVERVFQDTKDICRKQSEIKDSTAESNPEKKPFGDDNSNGDELIDRELKTLNLPIPKTSVQFFNAWKLIKAKPSLRFSYLKQINPVDLPLIFKESLETKVFSEMIETLTENVAQDGKIIYDFLLNLSNVKRFAALVMFMSLKDKKYMQNMIDFLRVDDKFSDEEVDIMVKKYEL